MSDLNKEALDVWGGLKPMIDQEISSRTQGMVQRRKAKVTTAPSLATNTIGVTEAFGDEMFLPFVSNMISAKVGDFVWIEWMYGATNAFVSSFAAVDDKNITVAGTLDVVQRRCYATLSSVGWYRVLKTADVSGTIIDFSIGRPYGSTPAEAHRISFYVVGGGKSAFLNETSDTNTLFVDKIRCTYGGGFMYFDVHYNSSASNEVLVYFDVYGKGQANGTSVSMGLTSVADSPSGETILTTYGLHANGDYTNTDLTVDGVLDVVPRRCFRGADFVSVSGWKRAMDINFGSVNDSKFAAGAIIDICIGSTYFDTNNMLRKITLNGIYNNVTFDDEHSKSNNLNLIDKIRYTIDSSNNGHIDIHYNYSSRSYLWVTFNVHTFVDHQNKYVASNLTAVADSPSGETVVKVYTFAANTENSRSAWSLSITGTANVAIDNLWARYAMKNGVFYAGGRFNITSFTNGSTGAGISLPINLGEDRGPETIGTMFTTTKTLQLRWNGSVAYITDAGGNYSGGLLNTGYWSFQIVAPIYN